LAALEWRFRLYVSKHIEGAWVAGIYIYLFWALAVDILDNIIPNSMQCLFFTGMPLNQQDLSLERMLGLW
jgi:hypothetical protein